MKKAIRLSVLIVLLAVGTEVVFSASRGSSRVRSGSGTAVLGETFERGYGGEAVAAGDKVSVQEGRLQLITEGNEAGSRPGVVWPENFALQPGEALEFYVEINPVANDECNADVDAGLVIGMPEKVNPNRFDNTGPMVYIEVKELNDQGRFTIIMDGKNVSFWGRPRTKDHGIPNIFTRQKEPYKLKIIAIDRGEETLMRFFFNHDDRPLKMYNYDLGHGNQPGEFVLDWTLKRELTENNYIGVYARQGGQPRGKHAITTFDNLRVRKISLQEAQLWMPADDFVMANIDYDQPTMTAVKAARDAGDMDRAKKLLVKHFRERTAPLGPDLDLEMARATAHGKESNWKEVADNACNGIYAKLSWFHGWAEPGELSDEDGTPKWERDPGFLTRHYHWAALAYAHQRTGDAKYAERYGEEVIDYVQREPTAWYKNPNLGGQLDTLDGSVIAEHMLWTGNIGRRLELTWWQTFEYFRTCEDFSDEAMFYYLDSVIRQCRLLTNPTVFLSWDDSGLHGAMALTKSSMLFAMADEAETWAEIGWGRVNYIVDNQFHPDGSHVSLSSGYNWATIRGLEHFLVYMDKNDAEIPAKMRERVESMYFHPLAITRPDFGNVDLNDGGWSPIDNPVTKMLEVFPHRKDYLFFETRGGQGEQPDPVSMYFPNAGQYVMRTGWGPREKYLFFDAGPWGASHGKQDALNIYVAYGNQLLIRNAGRGAYSGVGNTIHAGRSLSFNTLSPDWCQQNRIPVWEHEKWVGFNPPQRRWVSNDDFDYGEGFFEYGWHGKGRHIKGKHTRKVVFVKTQKPNTAGYYVVIDTVEPELDQVYTWRHPWQLEPGDVQIDPADNSTIAKTKTAAVRIIPLDPDGRMQVSIVKGQEKPELLGWRVYGESAKPWPTPTYAWQAQGRFTKAWIICPQMRDNWYVKSASIEQIEDDGTIGIIVETLYGDHLIMNRPQADEPYAVGTVDIAGDLGVVCMDRKGEATATLDVGPEE